MPNRQGDSARVRRIGPNGWGGRSGGTIPATPDPARRNMTGAPAFFPFFL